MNKRATGIVLLIISATLFISRNITHFIVAAIMGRKDNVLGEGMFEYALSVTRSFSNIPEIIALSLGVVYLTWAELDKGKDKH
ncbi:hypothetical protein C0Q44_08110 [Paenibacillus sp. PCH8]|uniref:hypothetical protein n=1 Tax=Paenibacillus sp. PCH8 TaxID=2066524 RepID=UPI000CF877FC|nr:hypothetical protein [Paenibacillus sp. PCH8]PQP84510.1 hypothetical protein C0Q44_08110 [Paenibacillus sp. PCH8]